MQTIEEYKAYTRQLENEVGTWHHAYDALMIERNALVNELLKYKQPVTVNVGEKAKEYVVLDRHAFEAMTEELETLRKIP